MEHADNSLDLATIAVLVFLYSLVSARLTSTPFTGPILFAAAGLIFGPDALGFIDVEFGSTTVRTIAELTLVLVVFSDASRVDRTILKNGFAAPGRMLGIGLPLTVALGALVGVVIFGPLGWWEAALLAAILAPTDAALGLAAVTNPKVPERLRQTINVESGLNDGLAAPLITFFIAGVVVAEGIESESHWVSFALREIGFGIAVGVVGGLLAGMAINYAHRKKGVDGTYRQILMVAAAIALFAIASVIEGNGFIAAYIGGFVVGNVVKVSHDRYFEFIEEEGSLLVLTVFLLFGAALLGPNLDLITWEMVLYAILSLTLIRMLPVVIALLGLGFSMPSQFYLAWFGPRGLASIVFLLTALEGHAGGPENIILGTVVTTVALSILLHGVSAEPVGRWVARAAGQRKEAAEHAPVSAPIRPRFPVRPATSPPADPPVS